MIVCIDPGHGQDNRVKGRYDPGNVQGGFEEATLTLQYAGALRDECVGRGWVAVMTRSDHRQSMPLGSRVAFALRAKADVLISIHTNSAEQKLPDGSRVVNEAPNGTEVFYTLSAQLARDISLAVSQAFVFRNRGHKFDDASRAVLKGGMPSVLVELGFQSNPSDRLKLVNPAYQMPVAKAIAAVLDRHIAGH